MLVFLSHTANLPKCVGPGDPLQAGIAQIPVIALSLVYGFQSGSGLLEETSKACACPFLGLWAQENISMFSCSSLCFSSCLICRSEIFGWLQEPVGEGGASQSQTPPILVQALKWAEASVLLVPKFHFHQKAQLRAGEITQWANCSLGKHENLDQSLAPCKS